MWKEKNNLMKATQKEIDKALSLLTETPLRIAAMTTDKDDTLLQAKHDKKSWSANDILAHVRSCADLWTHSIYAMLAENEPVFSDVNERKWAKVTRYDELPFAESLLIFSLQRGNLVRVLSALPFESWERSAMIFERKHTIFTQTRRMAKHEMEHLEQLESLLQSAA
jgi:DinB superfamily